MSIDVYSQKPSRPPMVFIHNLGHEGNPIVTKMTITNQNQIKSSMFRVRELGTSPLVVAPLNHTNVPLTFLHHKYIVLFHEPHFYTFMSRELITFFKCALTESSLQFLGSKT